VTLRAETQDRDVLISVSDTGPGIPQQELTNIFEAYRTVERPANPRVARAWVFTSRGSHRKHGGRIWVESEIGVGTTFFFTLPRA